MLSDRFHRVISYLRISVTDRCNFRCIYCMPEAGVDLIPRNEILTFEEISRVARFGASLGLKKIRLTGGEPTVRRDLPRLVQMLSAIEGIEEIALTTNAARLAQLAEPLKVAGLARVNISLDTLKRDRMQAIARRDFYEDVMHGIEAAHAQQFTPLKFNAVIIKGVNDDEVCDLLAFAQKYGAQMRFIEYMPMGSARFDERNKTVSAEEIQSKLQNQFDLQPTSPGSVGADPARLWTCRRTGAQAGFITSISQHFCDSCNRMRLTAQGGLRPCLHQNAEVDVRSILRSGGSEHQLINAFHQAASLKWAGHHMTNTIPLYSAKEMVALGG